MFTHNCMLNKINVLIRKSKIKVKKLIIINKNLYLFDFILKIHVFQKHIQYKGFRQLNNKIIN